MKFSTVSYKKGLYAHCTVTLYYWEPTNIHTALTSNGPKNREIEHSQKDSNAWWENDLIMFFFAFHCCFILEKVLPFFIHFCIYCSKPNRLEIGNSNRCHFFFSVTLPILEWIRSLCCIFWKNVKIRLFFIPTTYISTLFGRGFWVICSSKWRVDIVRYCTSIQVKWGDVVNYILLQ